MWEGLTKKMGKKNQKKYILPSAGPGTRQRRELYRVQGLGTRQRPSLPSARAGTRQRIFLKNLTTWAGSAVKCHFFCRVQLFAECCTRQRGLLPSAALCRVPGTLWHSAKPLFAECQTLPSATRSGTRQRVASPNARFLALGKAGGTRQICVLPQ